MTNGIYKVHFEIKTLNLDKKINFPLGKEIDSSDVVNLYENFRGILPKSYLQKSGTQVSEKLVNILDNFDVLFLDAFGVINIGNQIVPGIKRTIEVARDKGIILIIITNGSSYNSSKKINQLFELGLDFSFDEVISSRDVAERFISLNKPQGFMGLLGDNDDFKIPNLTLLIILCLIFN